MKAALTEYRQKLWDGNKQHGVGATITGWGRSLWDADDYYGMEMIVTGGWGSLLWAGTYRTRLYGMGEVPMG